MAEDKDKKPRVDNEGDKVEVEGGSEEENQELSSEETERLVKERTKAQAMKESLQHFKMREEKFSLFIDEKKMS